jgi:hypothetical protein
MSPTTPTSPSPKLSSTAPNAVAKASCPPAESPAVRICLQRCSVALSSSAPMPKPCSSRSSNPGACCPEQDHTQRHDHDVAGLGDGSGEGVTVHIAHCPATAVVLHTDWLISSIAMRCIYAHLVTIIGRRVFGVYGGVGRGERVLHGHEATVSHELLCHVRNW